MPYLSLFQFSKGARDEIYTFGQNLNGDVIQATNNPPTITVGDWGTAVFASSDANSQVPAHWTDIDDVLVFSNGIDQHQIFPGDEHKIAALVLYKGANPAPRIPIDGNDLTEKVLEEDPESADLNFAGPSTGEAVYIATPFPANSLNFIIGGAPTSSAGSNALKHYYVDNTGNFVLSTNFQNGTHLSAKDFAQDGSMTWDTPTDESPAYMFGYSGYWYRLDYASGSDATGFSDIKKISFNGTWRTMQNVWDGILIDVIEGQKEIDADSTFDTYAASSIDVSGMNTPDKLYLSAADKAYGFYLDPGGTPNTGSTTISVDRYDGETWQPISSVNDGTDGLKKAGFISWDYDEFSEKSQFNSSRYYAYWYRITLAGAVSDNVIISALYLPIFDIGLEFGQSGICSAAWKNRLCLTASIFDRDVYVSAKNRLNVLNGSDFAILEPGDGRRNRTVCIKKFHNEIIVWQIEKGRDGGCTTLFEGYNPATFGKLVLSSQVGTFNAKSAIVVDGATTTTKHDDKYQTMAYWISHYGIFMTDGRIVTMISQDIQNYFESDSPECIRRGYENEMWVEHDVDRSVLRFGLVSGDTAILPNVFPVFDLEDGTWSFDTFDNEDLHLTHALQCQADADQFPIIHIGACANNFVYLLNEAFNDDGEAIDFHLKFEFNNVGYCLDLREANLRMRAEDAGGLVKNVYENSRLITDDSETLDLTAEQTGDFLRRHRVFERIYEETHISLDLRENTVDQEVYLYDMNLDISSVLNK